MAWTFSNAGPQINAGPDLDEITTNAFGFHSHGGETKLRLLPQPWPEDNLPPNTASLLSIASRKGLVAAAGPENLVIATTEAVRKAYYDQETPSQNNVKPFTPQATIQIPRVSQVAFSADESCLVITAESGGGLAVYDVAALLQGNQEAAFQMGTNNTAVRALLPNPEPAAAHLFAVVLADGKLLVANLQNKQLSKVFREQVSCVSWSTRGKQLVAGLSDGTAAQYDPEGNEKALIPKPSEVNDPMTSISWVTNDEFLTIHTPVDRDTTDSTYHMIRREKASGSFTSQKLTGDPCPAYGMPRTPAHHFISRLRAWPPNMEEILILSSTAAVDVGVITKASVSLAEDDMASDSAVNTFTTTAMADDTRRAQMPVSGGEGMGDTSPIGMALDLSSNVPVIKPIPAEEMDESAHPAPALLLLNNEGLLCTWWVIYNESVRQKTAYPGLTSLSESAAAEMSSLAPKATLSAATATPAQTAFSASTQPTFGSNTAQPAFGSVGFGAKPAVSGPGTSSTPAGFGGPSALGAKLSPWSTAPGANASPATASPLGKATFGSATPIGAAGGFGAASAFGNKASPWGTPATIQAPGGSSFAQSSTLFGSSAPSGASGFAAIGAKSSSTPAFVGSGNENKPSQSPFASLANKDTPASSPFATIGTSGIAKPSSSFSQNGNSTSQQSFGSMVTMTSTTSDSFASASTVGANSSVWGTPQKESSAPEASMSDGEEEESGKASQETVKPEAPKSLFGQPSNLVQPSPFAQIGKPSEQPAQSPQQSTQSPFAQFGKPSDKPTESPKQSPFAQQSFSQSPFAKIGGDKPKTSPFAPSSDKPATSTFGQLSTKSTQSIFGQQSEKPSSIPKFTGFTLESSFKPSSDDSDEEDDDDDDDDDDNEEGPKKADQSFFGSGFGNMLGEPTKERSKEPTTPIKKEPGIDEPRLQDISTTPSSPPTAKKPEKPAEPEVAEPDDAPLPPDFTTYKPKAVEEDLPPIAGSPPVDLGDKSQLSSPVSSIGRGDEDEEDIGGPAEDEEESWEDDGDDDEEDEDEDEEDEEGPNQDDTVSRPPKAEAGNAFASRLTFPTHPADKAEKYPVPSTTPAGFPKAPLFAPTAKPTSPRSPSPVRKDRQNGTSAARSSSHQSGGKQQPLTVPSLNPQKSPIPSSAAQNPPPPPPEPEAGDLSDEEDARIQEILNSETEPSKELEPFVAHQDYIGQVSKPGIGGQIEKVYRDINSMIDTLGLNVRSLEAFVKGHESMYKQNGRERCDLEYSEDWCLIETEELGRVEESLGKSLDNGKVGNVKGKLNELSDLYKESTRLRAKTADMRKQIATRTDPQQRSNHRAAPLNTNVQMQQSELRQGVSKVQKLLQEAEEGLSILRADLATIQSTTNGTSAQRAPTVEAVTNTILKMTAMIEQKSGDVDVLEAQIRHLPQGLAGLSLDDGPDMMRSSVRSSNGRSGSGNSGLATPPTSRSRAAATSLGMSAMFGSSRFQTPQAHRKSQSTFGLTYTPEDSGELNRSVMSSRSLTGSTRKKMSDVSSEEVKRYLSKQDQRKKVLNALKQSVEKRGTRVTKVER
ncbi:hypothetical protein BDV97DRAFT_143472 [Delphinella strobiligena]|nr:hypothetical protein BDV97DRAFT_143472 [Delphinella strobiligena]